MSSKPSVPMRAIVDTRDGPPVPYDALLLAVGARPEPALAGAITFAGPRDVLAIRETIEALAPGRRHTIAFVAMAGTAWTLPLYELALMTAEYGRRHGLDLAIELFSYESAPLGIFGAEAASVRRYDAAAERTPPSRFAFAPAPWPSRARRRDRASRCRTCEDPGCTACRMTRTASCGWTTSAASTMSTASGRSAT